MDFFKLSKMRRPTGSGRGRRRKGAERGGTGKEEVEWKGGRKRGEKVEGEEEGGREGGMEGGRRGGRKRKGGGEGRGGRMKEVNTAMTSDEPCIKDCIFS